MADSSANSIARKCRKLDSTVVVVKSDKADTPRQTSSHSPNFIRMLVILVASLHGEGGGWGRNKGNQTKGPVEEANTATQPASSPQDDLCR